MSKQERMRKIVVGSAIVVIVLVALAVGVLWLPSRAPLQVTATTTTSQNLIKGGELILPIVDRNGFVGKSLSLSNFQGRVIVLEFMGSWCPPCGKAVSGMEALYKEYAERDVVFLAVAIPWPPSHPEYHNVSMTEFLSQYNSSLTYVYDSKGTLSSTYNVKWLPSVFVLSKNGTIYATFPGVMPSSDVAVSIDEALGYLPIALLQQADTVGDTFSDQGQPAVADKYFDITEVAFGELGPTYVFNITVAGPLPPASSASTSIFVEWDVLIDLDQNNATHPWGSYPLIDNGIGVDAVARLTWYNGSYGGELLTWPGGRRTAQSIGFRVNGAVATVYVEASTIGNPSGFGFVYAVRRYAEPGDTLIVADKAPNQGHFRYTNGSVTVAANLIAAQSGTKVEDSALIFSGTAFPPRV